MGGTNLFSQSCNIFVKYRRKTFVLEKNYSMDVCRENVGLLLLHTILSLNHTKPREGFSYQHLQTKQKLKEGCITPS